jgi:diguanylate cyclase (GGDEF)-like protein
MVRRSSALRAPPRQAVAGHSLSLGRRMLRQLLDENLRLTRELRELRKLRRLAERDDLTGLPNRRLCEERLAEELSRSRRGRGRCGSLLIVDMNDLKGVNDRLGHAGGDEALRETARVLRGALRTSDVCSRTGGDEFMILLPDTGADGARLAMARLRAAVMRAGARRDEPLSISVGAATWPTDGDEAGMLIEAADRAMYAEKQRFTARGRKRRVARPPCVLALVK